MDNHISKSHKEIEEQGSSTHRIPEECSGQISNPSPCSPGLYEYSDLAILQSAPPGAITHILSLVRLVVK